MVVALRDTDLGGSEEEEVAFLVMNRFVTPEGGMGLDVKSIAGSTPETSRRFSTWFNRKQGILHLCSSAPCIYSEDHFLHTTRARFFTRGGFDAPYYGAAQRRQVGKWLGEGEVAPEEAEVIEADKSGDKPPVLGVHGARKKAKEMRHPEQKEELGVRVH